MKKETGSKYLLKEIFNNDIQKFTNGNFFRNLFTINFVGAITHLQYQINRSMPIFDQIKVIGIKFKKKKKKIRIISTNITTYFRRI